MPLKLIKRHGSENWYIRGTIRGETLDESTGVADRRQAEAFKVKREWEIVQGQITGRRAYASFLEAATSYVAGGGEGRYVQALIDHFGARSMSEIGQVEAEKAAKQLLPGRRSATVNRQIFTPLSAIVRHAALRGLCDPKVFKRPTQPKGRVRWIALAEADRLIAACSPHLAPLVTFLLYTGARVGEALTLDWRDVDLARGQAVFLDTKNGEDRGVPLHPRVVAELANLKDRVGRVFLTDDGRPYRNNDAGGGQIKTAFHGACRRADITNFHPHDCRHTWATWHYAANRDIRKLMELGGWKTITMVQRYSHVNTAHLADSILALPGEYIPSQNTKVGTRRGGNIRQSGK